MLRPQGDAVDLINRSVEMTEADQIDRLRLIWSDNVEGGVIAQAMQALGLGLNRSRRSLGSYRPVVHSA